MPSCVVRCCKNSSIVQNKAVGITFHKFPRDCVWKRKWTDVIRGSRNDETWIPSKFSVVCSIHFENQDLYKTKFGLRRVKKYAIPKQYLTKPKIDNDVPEEEAVPSTSNTESLNQIVEIKLEPCNTESYYSDENSNEVKRSLISQPVCAIKIEQNILETSSHPDYNSNNEVEIESTTTSQEIVTVKVEPISPDTHNAEKSSNKVYVESTTTSQEIFKVKIEPDSSGTSDRNTNTQSIDIKIQEDNPSCATPSVHDSDIDSIYDSTLECKLKRQLRKQMRLGAIRQKKIKILNQKIRRMQKTNNRLQDTIKKLREKVQTFQSNHMFGGPHLLWETDTEGADLLNN